MESSFFQLLIFCAVMLFGSYLAGTAPLILPLSEEKLHRVSVFGAGLAPIAGGDRPIHLAGGSVSGEAPARPSSLAAAPTGGGPSVDALLRLHSNP